MASCSFFTLLYKEIPLSSQHAMCPKKVAAFFAAKKTGLTEKHKNIVNLQFPLLPNFLEKRLFKKEKDAVTCIYTLSGDIFQLANGTQKAGIHFRHHFIIFNFPFLHLIPDMPKKMKNSSRGFKITNQLSDAVVLKKLL